MENIIPKLLWENLEVTAKLFWNQEDNYHEIINQIVDKIVKCYQGGGKVVIMGNGGSAADAQHIAAELMGKFKLERKPLNAIALSTNTSIITAIGNDYSFNDIFSRQINGMVTSNDVVIGISTSGRSVNVINGLAAAKRLNATTISLTGNSKILSEIVDINLSVPSTNTPRIQEAHILIGHIVCELVEKELFAKKNKAVFLDRDGTINHDTGYISSTNGLQIYPEAAPAIKMLNNMGYLVIVVTNQSGINRGLISIEQLSDVHSYIYDNIICHGGRIDAFYHCPHRPDENCNCRKPKPGLLLEATKDYNIDLSSSYIIGDRLKDIYAGYDAGVAPILVLTGEGNREVAQVGGVSCSVAENILSAARIIANKQKIA